MARRPQLGSQEEGLGANDQIGDHARRDRPRELRRIPLGWTVSIAISAAITPLRRGRE